MYSTSDQSFICPFCRRAAFAHPDSILHGYHPAPGMDLAWTAVVVVVDCARKGNGWAAVAVRCSPSSPRLVNWSTATEAAHGTVILPPVVPTHSSAHPYVARSAVAARVHRAPRKEAEVDRAGDSMAAVAVAVREVEAVVVANRTVSQSEKHVPDCLQWSM
jgi:hypothetical protein